MHERFTNRLKQLSGESLSGYIMRTSCENGFINRMNVINYILNDISVGNEHNSKAYYLDNCPLEVLPKISYLTGVIPVKLELMTLIPVYCKFVENIDRSDNIIMNQEIVKDRRRFCNDCLREYGHYKSIWQIKRVEMCNIHMTKLTAKCSNCGKVQPYFTNKLAEFKCVQCDSLLCEQNSELIIDKDILTEQMKMYKNWDYLFDANINGFGNIRGMSKEKSLAIKVLYALQFGNNYFDMDVACKYIGKYGVRQLLTLINEDQVKHSYRINKSYITLHRLFNILDILGLSIEDFSKINATEEFIQSLKPYCVKRSKVLSKPGACQSPWCSSYMSNNKMKKITHYCSYEKDYLSVYVCTGCYMRYGYNKISKAWESVYDFTNVIWNIVLPLINKGMSREEIIRDTKLSRITIYKSIGYIASHSLASNAIIERYIPKYIPNDIIAYFEKVIKLNGAIIRNLQVILKCTYGDGIYFMSLDEVQQCILDNLYKYRGKGYANNEAFVEQIKQAISVLDNKGLDVSIKNIAELIKTSSWRLTKFNVNELIEEYKIKKKQKVKEEIIQKINSLFTSNKHDNCQMTLQNASKYIGKDIRLIKKNYPELMGLIKKEIQRHNNKLKKAVENKQVQAINDAVKKIYKMGLYVSYERVSEETNISMGTIWCYPSLRKAIKEAEAKYRLLE